VIQLYCTHLKFGTGDFF